jgi:hypothetical protein
MFLLVPGDSEGSVLLRLVGSSLIPLIMLLIPLSVFAAIFRSGLFDIDLVINRALVYGTLTASLALVHLGAVAGLQRLVSPLAGGSNQLIIVASTLLIAALFNPLRRRIQHVIDRRFYRSKYDARRTLEAFSSRLRDETELRTLGDDLVGVVKDTMQPAHVSLWFASDRGKEGDDG